MSLLTNYLTSLRDLRTTGAAVAETSYYPALATLLDAVGAELSPYVRCVGQLKNVLGSGSPDFVLYSADQFPRGVVEAKSTGAELNAVAASPQVAKYVPGHLPASPCHQLPRVCHRHPRPRRHDAPARPRVAPCRPVDPRRCRRHDAPAQNFAFTAGWGHFGQGGSVMPGRGRVSAVNDLDGGLEEDTNGTPLRTGLDFYRVFLNERACWDRVPRAVWEYTLGGYPVLKKWLSYHEEAVLGWALRPEEAREFTAIARRVAALLAFGAELAASYHAAAKASSSCL